RRVLEKPGTTKSTQDIHPQSRRREEDYPERTAQGSQEKIPNKSGFQGSDGILDSGWPISNRAWILLYDSRLADMARTKRRSPQRLQWFLRFPSTKVRRPRTLNIHTWWKSNLLRSLPLVV